MRVYKHCGWAGRKAVAVGDFWLFLPRLLSLRAASRWIASPWHDRACSKTGRPTPGGLLGPTETALVLNMCTRRWGCITSARWSRPPSCGGSLPRVPRPHALGRCATPTATWYAALWVSAKASLVPGETGTLGQGFGEASWRFLSHGPSALWAGRVGTLGRNDSADSTVGSTPLAPNSVSGGSMRDLAGDGRGFR